MSGPIISADWAGRVIDGRFALHEWLGGSGASGVFRTDLPQPVAKGAAIKLIPAEGAEANAYLAGWAKAANLSHPHLIRVFRSGRYQFGSIELVYVVMECADEVLAQILPSRALTTDETREMVSPLIDGLGYLHEKGFVHGHLRPSNILVVNDQIKISGDNITAGGMRNRFEPPSVYDAPEFGTGVLRPASDVWSLGMTLVEALTQRTLTWDRSTSRDVAVPAEVPRFFADIVRDCLRRNPDDRCSLEEIRARLTPSQPIAFPGGKAEAERPAAVRPVVLTTVEDAEESETGSKRKWILPLVLGLVAVIAIAVALIFRGSSKPGVPAANESGQSVQAPAGSEEKAPAVNVPPSASDVAQPGDKHGHSRVKGEVTARPMPNVAPEARRTIRGTVTVAVRADVDATGKVSDVSFRSEGPSRYFGKEALSAARGWQFRPAEKNGANVPSVWIVRFKFRQRGDEASATEEKP